MPPPQEGPPARRPVLSIGTDRIEWLDARGDEPRYLSVRVEETTPLRLARAAAGLLKENKVRHVPCVLSLSEGMVAHRTVRLAELSAKERRRVLHRKAANLLEAPPADTLYAALPMAAAPGDDAGAVEVREWLLLALRRRDARALQLELRRLGVRVHGVVSALLAEMAAAASRAEAEDDAIICVGAGARAVTLGLVQHGELVQTTSLDGTYDANPSMASCLLQELRGFEAFWRKRSRGGELSRVVLVGFTPEHVVQLSPAIHASLPGTQVVTYPELDAGDLPVDRVGALLAALVPGELQVDLSVPLPPRVPRMVVGALVACAAAAGVAWKGREHLVGEVARQRHEIEDLRERTADAAELDRRHDRMETALAALEAERARYDALLARGVNLGSLLADTLAAFANRGALLALRVDSDEEGGQVTLTGVTAPDPGRSLAALRALAADLERGPHLAGVVLQPPTGMPRKDADGQALLEFALEAAWEGAR